MPATYNAAAGSLTIGSVAMFCPAWSIQNLHILFEPAAQRGDDEIIPGAAGGRAVRRRATTTKKSLQMVIWGDVSRTGTPAANKLAQLQTNLDYLNDNVVAPVGSGDGTRSAVLTPPTGSARTEPIHVEGLRLGELNETGLWIRAVLEISIPSGRFT